MKTTKYKETEIGKIPEDWEADVLGSHTKLIKGISYRSEDYCSENEGFIFINLKCVARNGGFREEGIKYYKGEISEEQFVNIGDILIANTDLTQNREIIGSPIKVPNLKNDRKMCISLDLTKIDITSKKLNGDFLYYYLMSPRARHFMIAYGNGTTVVHLSTKNVPNMFIPLPSIEEQKRIGTVFLNFDSKIELNKQMNKTLESIGQTLFKRWFVDFEFPDENGKSYKSSGGKMVDSELGEIPKGWTVGDLIDITEIIMGQSPPGESYNEAGDGMPFYQGNRDFGFRYPSNRVFCVSPTRLAKKGDILLSVRAPVGELNVSVEECAIGRGVCAIRMRNISNGFLLHFLKTKNDLWNNFNSEGTVFGCLNKTELHKIKIVIPPDAYLKTYDKITVPIENQILNNEMQSRELSQIRNSLFPRLMSGRIRVGVAE